MDAMHLDCSKVGEARIQLMVVGVGERQERLK